MLLTSDLIYERLKKIYQAHLYCSGKPLFLRSVLIYDGSALSAGKVYLMTPEQLEAVPANREGFLVITAKTSTFAKRRFDWIEIGEEADLLTLLRLVTEIFDEFHEWRDAMDACPDSREGIAAMLEVTGRILEGSLLLVDAYYNYVATNSKARQSAEMFDPEKPHRPSQDILQNLIDDPEIYQIINKKEPFMYPARVDSEEAFSLCLNLFLEGKEGYYYRILYVADNNSYPNWKEYMLEKLGERIIRVASILSYSDPLNRLHTDLTNQIRSILLDPALTVSSARIPLENRSWSMEDLFQIYVFYPFQRGISPGSGEYVRNRLELYFQDSCSFLLDDTIVMIHNLTRSNQKGRSVRDLLPDFLKEHLYKVGISTDRVPFTQIRYSYQQAQSAYTLGCVKHPHYWYYKFEDYCCEYILSQSTQQIPAQLLLPKAITVLQDYDRKNETELLYTLKTYIQEKYNATHAAQKLYIHRTTFLDRLERIRNLTNVDLDSWGSRMMLMMAFKMLEVTDRT